MDKNYAQLSQINLELINSLTDYWVKFLTATNPQRDTYNDNN